MTRSTRRCAARIVSLALTSALVALGGCESLSSAANGGFSAQVSTSAGSSGGSPQQGSENSGTKSSSPRANVPDAARKVVEKGPQESREDLLEVIELSGDEISMTPDETAKATMEGEARCRWRKFEIHRQHEGNGNYMPPDVFRSRRGLRAGVNGAVAWGSSSCDEAESAPARRSIVRLFSDNDTVIGGEWTTDWDVVHDDGNPIRKERTAKVYQKKTRAVEQQVPTPTKQELKEIVAKAIPEQAYTRKEEYYDKNVTTRRVESVVVSTDLQYVVDDPFDAEDPDILVPVETFEVSETYVQKKRIMCQGGTYKNTEGIDDFKKYRCAGDTQFYFEPDRDGEPDYTLQGTPLRVAKKGMNDLYRFCDEEQILDNAFDPRSMCGPGE